MCLVMNTFSLSLESSATRLISGTGTGRGRIISSASGSLFPSSVWVISSNKFNFTSQLLRILILLLILHAKNLIIYYQNLLHD